MTTHRRPTAVLGDGAWGTTLAILLHRQGQRVLWWGAFPENLARIRRHRENKRYLPGVRIPRGIRITERLAEAIEPAGLVVLAVPTQHQRAVLRRIHAVKTGRKLFVTVAKGIETRSLKRMSQVIQEELGPVPIGVLSGPNIAREIAMGQPASSVVASRNAQLAARIQRSMTGRMFRLYTSTDVVGVELGGALKNPIAIAAGISDGLGLGMNAKAAIIARGIAEMARLGTALGARAETFWGLSGLGDLVTTCLGGRNRWLGEQVGKGKALKTVLKQSPTVLEGVETTRAAMRLARRHGVELPIIAQVYAVLFRGKTPQRAMRALMLRQSKAETRPNK